MTALRSASLAPTHSHRPLIPPSATKAQRQIDGVRRKFEADCCLVEKQAEGYLGVILESHGRCMYRLRRESSDLRHLLQPTSVLVAPTSIQDSAHPISPSNSAHSLPNLVSRNQTQNTPTRTASKPSVPPSASYFLLQPDRCWSSAPLLKRPPAALHFWQPNLLRALHSASSVQSSSCLGPVFAWAGAPVRLVVRPSALPSISAFATQSAIHPAIRAA
jgi:hypothetical protein